MNITIGRDFPGGNIALDHIEGNSIYVQQQLRDTSKWWFYWCFRMNNVKTGETYHVNFVNGDVVGFLGPAISYDNFNWTWLGSESVIDRASFRYTHESEANSVYFCFCLPYQMDHLESFLDQHASIESSQLTDDPMDGPLLRIGDPNNTKHVLITARHHACESTGNYVMEGIIQYVLQSSGYLSRECVIDIVPFVDFKGVLAGDQGKARFPHDHNRDYQEPCLYSSTKAIMEMALKHEYVAALDLHSPNKWGGVRDDRAFFVKPQSSFNGVDMLNQCLMEIANKNYMNGDIAFDGKYLVEHGTEWWNKGDSPNFAKFMTNDANCKLCATLEVAYAGYPESIHTQDSMRKIGYLLGTALDNYFSRSV